MKSKAIVITVLVLLLVMGCNKGIEQTAAEDPPVNQDKPLTQSTAESKQARYAGTLLDLLQAFMGEEATIESVAELPFEWRSTANEIVEISGCYQAVSLDDFRQKYSDMITGDDGHTLTAFDSERGRELEIKGGTCAEGFEYLNVAVNMGGDTEDFWLRLEYLDGALCETNRLDPHWPHFAKMQFYPNGNIFNLKYCEGGPEDFKNGTPGYCARFDEGGVMTESYKLTFVPGSKPRVLIPAPEE